MRAKQCRTLTKGGCTVGPTSSVSFSDTPEDDLADASKTALSLVVVLESFFNAWIGK